MLSNPRQNAPTSDPFAEARKRVASGQVKPTHTTAPKYPLPGQINPHELDALYQAGTLTVVGSNSHYAGLRAVYDAGVKGAKK
jgi:hypothetical protein